MNSAIDDSVRPDVADVPARAGRGPLRWIVNGLLVLHLTAIILAPASVSPSSDIVRAGWTCVRPYLEAFYLNNGYHFFAPEPSESTLLGFTVERADGSTFRGRIPNREIGPRLLYHRHFMLSEHMNVAPEEIRDKWYRSYAMHLARKYGGTRVGLTRVTHRLPSPEMVRHGVRLDDPGSYDEQPLGLFRCEESSAR